jgi:ParB family chromosome partitioning protein
MAKKRGLGKGLDALIGKKSEEAAPKDAPKAAGGKAPDEVILQAPIKNIEANPKQARKIFEETALADLAESIRQSGILQPLVVTRKAPGTFNLIAGERRLRAARLAGLTKVPVRIVEADDDKAVAVLGLVENLQREDLDALEEAEAFRMLAEEFGLKQEEISKAVAKSRPYVANSIRLLDLPDRVLEQIRRGALTAGHGRAILRLPEVGARVSMAKTIVAKKLSVREAENLAERLLAKKEAGRKEPPSKKHPHGWLADELKQRLGTKVDLAGKADQGRIVIHYYSEEDLTRIVEILKG